MAQEATLESVRERVLARKLNLSDEVVSVKSLAMDPEIPGRMIVQRGANGKMDSYVFDERVYGQAAAVVYGCPGAYIKKMVETDDGDPSIAALLFNFHVNQVKDKEILLRFEKRGEEKVLRAIKPASWNTIPYEDSLDTLITKFGANKKVEVERFNDARLVLNFVTKKLDYKTNKNLHLQRDDPIEWGQRFQDSDVGMGDCQVMPYTKRLVCTNGMTTTSKGLIMHISHSGAQSRVPAEVQANIRTGIEMVDSYATAFADQITKSQGVEIPLSEEGIPVSAMNRLERDQAVTKLMQKHVLEAWVTEGDTIPEPSVYRLSNAVTRAGTHAEELTEDARLHLQGVGGRILELGASNYRWD